MTEAIDLDSLDSCDLKPATSYISVNLCEPVKLRLGNTGLAADKPLTIPQYFQDAVNKYGHIPALVYQDESVAATTGSNDDGNGWTTLTFTEYKEHVDQVARAFVRLGLEPHTSVGILSFNCPEWFYAEMGALFAGGVVAGIYTTNSAEAVHHVLSSSDARICVVDDGRQMEKVRSIKDRLPQLKAVVQIYGPFADYVGVDDGYYRWADVVAMQCADMVQEELQRRLDNIAPNQCAMLIYTSGTVGMPKAVMLTHDAIVFSTKANSARLKDIERGAEVFVSYLPLNHIAAQFMDVFLPIENAGTCYFADRNALKGTLDKTLAKARPTRFFGVPRVFEKMEAKLVSVEADLSMLSKFILGLARGAIQNYRLNVMQGQSSSTWRFWLASKVTSRIKTALGLDRCKSFLVGGAPVSVELKKFFFSHDMPITDIYGTSESGVSNMNLYPSDWESSGKTFDGVEMRIFNPDETGHGEICTRGRLTMMGYLNDLEKTEKCLKEDGWLHSGDIGYINTNGDLIVSGRMKELIITAGGENIPPMHIENIVKRELKGISNAVLIGDKRNYLTLLVTIKTAMDPDTGHPLDELLPESIQWMKSLGLNDCTRMTDILSWSPEKSGPHPSVLQSIQEGIDRANQKAISNAQQIKKFAILPHDFSIPTGELGPTLKFRRNIVHGKYADIINNLYK